MSDWRTHYTATVSVSYQPARDGVPIRHLVVQKRSGKDGISWDVLQRIKNDVLGSEVLAIEMYPDQRLVVYEKNARHLWEVPPGLVERMPSLV